MALIGSTVDPRMFVQDYSGFANAAAIRAAGMMNFGQQVGGAIANYGEQQKEAKAGIAKGKAALEFAKTLHPELGDQIAQLGQIFNDPSKSQVELSAVGNQMGDYVAALLGEERFKQEFGLRKKEVESSIEERNSRPPAVGEFYGADGTYQKQWDSNTKTWVTPKMGSGYSVGPGNVITPETQKAIQQSARGFLTQDADISKLPLGMRNNNPTNIIYPNQEYANKVGAIGASINEDSGSRNPNGGKYKQLVFPDPITGMTAGAQLALRKYKAGMTSANQIIASDNGWTPGNTEAAANIAEAIGLTPKDDLGLDNPQRMEAFLQALTLQEHGDSARLYDSRVFKQAVQNTFGESAQIGFKPDKPLEEWQDFERKGILFSRNVRTGEVKQVERGALVNVSPGSALGPEDLKKGYREERDDKGNVFISAIPDSPAFFEMEIDRLELAKKKAEAFAKSKEDYIMEAQDEQNNLVGGTQNRAVEDALNLLNEIPQGSGVAGGAKRALSAAFPGSTVKQLEAALAPIKNTEFVKNIGAMRAASPTGGAVGQVSDAEGQRFEQLRASLDVVNQDPDQLRRNLLLFKEASLDYIHGTKAQREKLIKEGKITPEINAQIEALYPRETVGPDGKMQPRNQSGPTVDPSLLQKFPAFAPH